MMNLLSFTGDETTADAVLVATVKAPHTIEAWSLDRITRTCLCLLCVFVCTRALVMLGCACMLTSFFHETADLVDECPMEATDSIKLNVMQEEASELRCYVLVFNHIIMFHVCRLPQQRGARVSLGGGGGRGGGRGGQAGDLRVEAMGTSNEVSSNALCVSLFVTG